MPESSISRIGQGEFFLIAGPCVIESEVLCLEVAERVAEASAKRNIPFVFKSSYRKANRLSAGSYSGPGLQDGLAVLAKVKERLSLPILTDVHETSDIPPVAEVADIIQIPAFLCRQTDLVVAAAETGRWVNIKKGQFLAPEDMAKLADKAIATGNKKVMLTERGTSFGYRNLVVDFRALLIMAKSGLPVIYDATHSLQLPGGGGAVSTGQPEYIIPMARAAAAVGINGLFVEVHPEPAKAKSDAGAMLPLDRIDQLLDDVLEVRKSLAI